MKEDWGLVVIIAMLLGMIVLCMLGLGLSGRHAEEQCAKAGGVKVSDTCVIRVTENESAVPQ